MESLLTAEISASAVRANLTLLRQRIPPATQICVAAKADCYGHGLDLLWPILAEQANAMGVATPAEASHLRGAGYQGPILMFFPVMAQVLSHEARYVLEELISKRIWLTVVALDEIPFLAEAAGRIGMPAMVHIKVDSGMGRSGIRPEALPAFLAA